MSGTRSLAGCGLFRSGGGRSDRLQLGRQSCRVFTCCPKSYGSWDATVAGSESLAEKLLAARKVMGLNQKAITRRLGIDLATLARWKSGKRRPSLKAPIILSLLDNLY
jgi:DNA-binding XRE family transcriptional regulator